MMIIRKMLLAVPLKYLNRSWKNLEMPLISWEISLNLTWYEVWVISSASGKTNFTVTDTQIYAPVVTSSIQDNVKLLRQLE